MFLFFTNPILIIAAVIPAIILMIQIRKADKLDIESPGLIFSLVLQGVLATVFALFAERIGSVILGMFFSTSSIAYNILLYFIVVGCSEEGFKYLLLRRKTWYSPEFNCQFDAVVYAVTVSLGFALWENISYVVSYGFGTALLRAVTAVPGHACFGVFMGAFYGLAKYCDNNFEYGKSSLFRWMAFFVPAIMHGCYDYIASIEYVHSAWIFAAFIILLFIITSLLVKNLSNNDRYINN